MPLEDCLTELYDEDTPLTYSNLIELSDMVSAETPQFIAAWNQVTSERRAQVIERLVELAEENAQLDFTAVLKIALADDDYLVQEKAIAGMWEAEDRTVIPLLLNILQSDAPPPVRASAAAALGKYALLAQEDKILPKDAQAVQESLMRSLQDESDPLEVRRRALEAVSPFNTPRIQEYIRWAYGSGEQTLKGSSIYAMGKTQETAWLPPSSRNSTAPTPPCATRPPAPVASWAKRTWCSTSYPCWKMTIPKCRWPPLAPWATSAALGQARPATLYAQRRRIPQGSGTRSLGGDGRVGDLGVPT